MSNVPIVLSLIMLALTVLGLVVKITSFTTKIELYVKEMRKERRLVLRIPMMEMRIGYIEQHLKIKSPQSTGVGQDERDEESEES